jgi:hypothetical protein
MLFDKTTGGYTQISKVVTLTIGTEYHITATYTGTGGNAGLSLYINKVKLTSVTSSGASYVRMRNTGSTLFIGRSVNGLFFNGTISFKLAKFFEIFTP